MSNFIFNFRSAKSKKINNPKNLLGGKGINLVEMGKLGLPVPSGFTISTKVCEFFYNNGKKLNDHEEHDSLTVNEIFIHSSNIGISKIIQDIDNKEILISGGVIEL